MGDIKRILLLLFILNVQTLLEQLTFYEEGKKVVPLIDTLYPIKNQPLNKNQLNYFSDSTLSISILLDNLLLRETSPSKFELHKSIALTNLAFFSSSKASSLFSKDSKKRANRIKKLKQILYTSTKSFGLITVHTFTIPLLKKEKKYFYDKRGPGGEFNMYKGDKKEINELKDDYVYQLLDKLTYEDIEKILIKKLRDSGISAELSKKRTIAVGYHFFLDKKSLKKDEIPQLKCIVILGHKRLARIKKRVDKT